MTKAELVALITHQTGVEKTAAEAVVEAFMRNIKETMIAGEDVFLRGSAVSSSKRGPKKWLATSRRTRRWLFQPIPSPPSSHPKYFWRQ